MATLLGVDVGGTFTDLALVDSDDGSLRVAKVPTTLENQARGVLAGIDALEASPEQIDLIVHGTTTGTNALLERRGALCGLVTTRGFRDLLTLGRRTRPQNYGLFGSYTPLVPRELCFEVDERVRADGTVISEPSAEELTAIAETFSEAGVESVAVFFMNSYANPGNEETAVRLLSEAWQDGAISAAVDISSQFREFERLSTTVVNAYLRPLIARYLQSLESQLSEAGYGRPLMIMKANGGMIDADGASRLAVHTVLSGPAAGVTAAAREVRRAGFPDAISCDMGGTSFDVGLIRDGEPATAADIDIDYNVPLQISVVDVHTIGSGGGSIAHVDSGGLLHVGPESAGSRPGPIAFGRGGSRFTVTDANVLLGRLPENLLATSEPADLAAIERGALQDVGDPLGLPAEEAALAVLRVVNNAMAGAIRKVSLQRGHDPRRFALIPFGGAGPVHAVELARELSIPTVVVPARPGIVSALGCVVANVRHDFTQTVNRELEQLDTERVAAILAEQEASGREQLAAAYDDYASIEIRYEGELQYAGQTHVVAVELPGREIEPGKLRSLFEDAYQRRFGVRNPELPVVLTNVRTTAVGTRRLGSLSEHAGAAAGGESGPLRAERSRRVRFAEGWVAECPIFDRDALLPGHRFDGPAIVEQSDTTTVVPPGAAVDVDEHGNLLISTGGADGD
jgi:N-methylhydantoinase A